MQFEDKLRLLLVEKVDPERIDREGDITGGCVRGFAADWRLRDQDPQSLRRSRPVSERISHGGHAVRRTRCVEHGPAFST